MTKSQKQDNSVLLNIVFLNNHVVDSCSALQTHYSNCYVVKSTLFLSVLNVTAII